MQSSNPRAQPSAFRGINPMRALALMAVLGIPPLAIALPEGGQVVAGDVSFEPEAGRLDLTQTGDAAIVNWADFSIGTGEIVNIHQSVDAAMLNRVLGANPSELLGQLNADGRVYLVNPNGVLVGADARIDAGSFFATTAQVADAEFLVGGDLAFNDGSAAAIVNLGVINAHHGDAVLVAYRVANEGEITAENGTAALTAATQFVYAPTGDARITVASSAALGEGAVGVDNAGLIDAADAELTAADGNLFALAVNQSGVVRATGVERIGGRVLLTASQGVISVKGELSAHRADGSGGAVLVGGDFHGDNPEVANAAFAFVGDDAVIDVRSRAEHGDGGQAVVWADDHMIFRGFIDARAGTLGGDGGNVEVSGRQRLDFRGLVDLRAPFGQRGELLLDPATVTIQAAGPDENLSSNGDPLRMFQDDEAVASVLTVATLEDQLELGDVTVETSTADFGEIGNADIDLLDAVTWATGSTLTLKSGDSININADLTGGEGSEIVFSPGLEFDDFWIATEGTLTVDASSTVTADTVTIQVNVDANPEGAINVNLDPGNLQMGPVAFEGILVTDTLNLAMPSRGFGDDVTIANPANQIGTLATSVTDGNISGDLTVVDDDLTITGNFGTIGDVTLSAAGDLTLAPGATLEAWSFGDPATLTLAAGNGSFINQAGANALTVIDGNGRILIYSDAPSTTTLGGIIAEPVYNKTFAGNAPPTVTQTGDRVLYSLAPTITFTANPQIRNYGDENAALGFTFSGLLPGDTAGEAYSGDPAVSTTITNATDVGIHIDAIAIEAGSVVASDYDYQIAFATGDFTIDPAELTVIADDASREYGDANPAFSSTITGFKLGQDATVLTTQPTYDTAATAASDVGAYDIAASGAAAANYTFDYTPGTLTVHPAPLTLTANNQSRDYGDDNLAFTVEYDGFKLTDDESVVTGLTVTTDATDASDVGNYDIDATGGTATNYAITHVDGTLRIDPAAVTVTADDASRLYGGTNPAFTGSVNGLKLGQDASVLTNLGYSANATSASDAGDYAITPGGSSNPNYTYTYTPGALTVNPAELTITANNAASLYNEAIPGFSASYAGLVNGDTADAISHLTLTTAAIQGSDVGTYDIIAADATSPNYTINFLPGLLTISNQFLTITADNFTRLYGAANPAFTATTIGFVNDDDLSILTDPITFATVATENSNVGTYTITPAGATAPNYDITFVPGTLTIDPALLTITATDFARAYGDANPAFTASFGGLVADDTATEITGLVLTSDANNASDVGGFAITPSGASNANYAITFVEGMLTIEPATLTVTLDDVSREYGDANPPLTSTITGFKLDDDASVLTGLAPTTDAVATSAVGDYGITTDEVTATNYTVAVEEGILSVDPAALTVTADDQTREYGDPNTAFTASTTGFKLDEDASILTGLILLNSATAASDAGSYAIIPFGASAPNYTVTFEPGELTVEPAPLLISADIQSRFYGSANPTLTATFSGLKLVDDSSDITDLVLGTSATPQVFGVSSAGAAVVVLGAGERPLREAQSRGVCFNNNFTCTLGPEAGNVPEMGSKQPIDEHQLKNWCLLEEFSRRLDKAAAQMDGSGGGRPDTFEDPRRRLSENDYLCLLLFGLFNPVVDSMRGLCQASALKRVREQVCSHRVSLGSFSEAQAVVDPALLEKVFMDLVAEERSCQAVLKDPALQSYRQTLTLVDGTLWEALPRMDWARWRTQNGVQRAVKLELKFNLLDDRPRGARIAPGRTCERALLRQQLEPNEFYVADRYYGKDYQLLADIEALGSFYVIRLRDDALMRVERQLDLSEQDRSSHVIEDCLVRLGQRAKGPVRRVVTVVADDGQEIILVTNKQAEELPAELIAQIYRYRWQIELFFKWLKSILGCRHWFAESAQGVAIQIYTALIAALLLTRHCGKKPNKRQMELLRFYFMGYASLEELEEILPALAQKTRKH